MYKRATLTILYIVELQGNIHFLGGIAMFIIFGSKTIRKTINTKAEPCVCENCGNEKHWDIVRDRLFFSLFFIPVLPLHSTYYEMCPICKVGRKIKKSEAKNAGAN